MSTETNELNRLFNNISGSTVSLKLPQTKWLQMINEWIEENGIGGGSSYKGVTVLSTETYINDYEELSTTYEFSIWTDGSSVDEYWGDGHKACLLIHTLNNEEIILTPVTLISSPDVETGTGTIYSIQTKSGIIQFSSIEEYDDMITAYLDNAQDFNDLEDGLKASSLIQGESSGSNSDEILIGYGELSSETSNNFRMTIRIPNSITDTSSLKTYVESAKAILWLDGNTGISYLTYCEINLDNEYIDTFKGTFDIIGQGGNPQEGLYFDFNSEDKEYFIEDSIGGGSSSGGPNYQQPFSGTYGSEWDARIFAETEPEITIRNLEVDENYMLLRLTYQEISEEVTPVVTKVFSIIHLEGDNDDANGKIYYVVWGIESNHTIYETTEGDPQPTSSYLRFYPNIIGFNPKTLE